MIYTISRDTAGLLHDLENAVEFLAQYRHILSNPIIGDASIDLGRGDMFVPQHLADSFQRNALRERNRRGEGMPRHVHRRIERQTGMFGDMTQRHVHRLIVALDREDLATRQMQVLIAVVHLFSYR